MRKLSKTSILNQHEIVTLTHGIHGLVGEEIIRAAEVYGLDVDTMLRFMAVAEKCRIAREEKRLTLKDVARELRVPQYRLKDIESGHVKRVETSVLMSYIEFLEIRRWFSRWGAQNRSLYRNLISTSRHQNR